MEQRCEGANVLEGERGMVKGEGLQEGVGAEGQGERGEGGRREGD